MLSCLSVSNRPDSCLRHWCSSRYLRISLLHLEFRYPLRYSSHSSFEGNFTVELQDFTSDTHLAAYAPFTPSESE